MEFMRKSFTLQPSRACLQLISDFTMKNNEAADWLMCDYVTACSDFLKVDKRKDLLQTNQKKHQ